MEEYEESARAARWGGSLGASWTRPRGGGVGLAVLLSFYLLEVVLVALTVLAQSPPSPGLFATDVAVGVLTVALLPALRRRPVPTGYLLAALAGLSMAATPISSLAVLQVAQRRKLADAVRLAAFAVATQLVRELWRPVAGVGLGWWVIEVCAVATALVGWGAYSQSRSALISSLRERAQRAEADQARRLAEARTAERHRIAREMHDVLAHRLTLLATYAGALEYRPESAPERIAEAAGVIRGNVHTALDELRQVIYVLRDDTADDDSPERPQPSLPDLPELVDQSRKVGAVVHLDLRVADPAECPIAVGRTAYRIIQEALTNARRHAPGVPVRVAVSGEPGRQLSIDARNTLVASADGAGGTGTGLIGLTERVSLAGGEVEYGPKEGEFRLHVVLPWAL